jgi:Family of unknown function (DUF5681)
MKLKLHEPGSTARNRSFSRRHRQQNSDAPVASDSRQSDGEYRVGPGRPPREYQFKPGQSGNPNGAKRKSPLVPDLKAIFERALNEKLKHQLGEREEIMTKAAAGITTLINQYVEGDRHARRDLFAWADKLGIDLTAGHKHVIERALAPPLTADDQALVDDYVRRRWKELNSIKNDADPSLSRPEESQRKPEESAE